MASDSYHEPYEFLPPAARDLHRALRSLMEELEAVDWYNQRASVCEDDDLRAVLEHNRDEEIEHAIMTLEWVRRRNPVFDDNARKYLFTSAPITAIEDAATSGEAPAPTASDTSTARAGASLGIGSLKA